MGCRGRESAAQPSPCERNHEEIISVPNNHEIEGNDHEEINAGFCNAQPVLDTGGGNFVTQLLVCAGSLAVIMPALVKAWREFEHVEQRIQDHYDTPEVSGT